MIRSFPNASASAFVATELAYGQTKSALRHSGTSIWLIVVLLSSSACGSAPQTVIPESAPEEYFTPSASVETVAISTLELEHGELTLKPGQAGQLRLTLTLSNGSVYRHVTHEIYTPHGISGSVQWYSNNASIVSVSDSGRLSAITDGTATVKASFKNFALLAVITVASQDEFIAADTDDDNGESATAEESTSVPDAGTDAGNNGVSDSAPAQADNAIMPDDTASIAERFLGNDDDAEESPAGDEVSLEVGDNGGYGANNLPDVVYGAPVASRTDVVSLGNGGVIAISLGDFIIVDGDGADFTVFENAFSGWVEPAVVSVSADGIIYHAFDCDPFDPEAVYVGCAGITPVNYADDENDYADPELSGGDTFDLADVGLATARHILITDGGACVNPMLCVQPSSGFDLDAVIIVNGIFAY